MDFVRDLYQSMTGQWDSSYVEREDALEKVRTFTGGKKNPRTGRDALNIGDESPPETLHSISGDGNETVIRGTIAEPVAEETQTAEGGSCFSFTGRNQYQPL